MARLPKPWFRADRGSWFVTVNGTRHNLGEDKKLAFDRFYELMRTPATAKVASSAFAAIADSFLDWVNTNRAPDTYEWYRYRLERFCQRYPDLAIQQIRPFHVQQWVDSYKELAQTSRRNYFRSVKRCMKWAKQQGYVAEDSIEGMEVPGAESRDICITADEFRNLCSYIRDETFLDLCRVTFEIGCRPQEILRIEARHFDSKYSRWVMPVNEAKGKKKPRIIYLTPYALATTEKLVAQFPTGMLFRNTRQKPWTTDAVNCGFDRLRVRMGRSAMKDHGLEMSELMKQALRQDGAPIKDPMKLSQRERDKLSNKVASRYAPQYSLYALRHSWATNALQSGLDALTVAVLMGHSDPSTLSRVYQHLSHNPEHLLKQVEKLFMYQTGTAMPT